LSAQAEAGNVKLVYNPHKDWISAYLDEMHAFPTGKHDDQVDGSSGAFNKLTLEAVEPWDVPVDPGARSLIVDAPEGVFLDDGRESNEEPLWN